MAWYKKNFSAIFEIAKWALVVFLMWPMLTFQMQKMSLWRMVFGVMFAVIFLGKMFYDVIIDNYKQKKEHYTIGDLFILVGFVVFVAILIAGGVLVIGLYLSSQLQPAATP